MRLILRLILDRDRRARGARGARGARRACGARRARRARSARKARETRETREGRRGGHAIVHETAARKFDQWKALERIASEPLPSSHLHDLTFLEHTLWHSIWQSFLHYIPQSFWHLSS